MFKAEFAIKSVRFIAVPVFNNMFGRETPGAFKFFHMPHVYEV